MCRGHHPFRKEFARQPGPLVADHRRKAKTGLDGGEGVRAIAINLTNDLPANTSDEVHGGRPCKLPQLHRLGRSGGNWYLEFASVVCESALVVTCHHRISFADRLRKSCEPDAGASKRTRARDRDPTRAWGSARKTDPATAYGESADFAHRSSGRTGDRAQREPIHSGVPEHTGSSDLHRPQH